MKALFKIAAIALAAGAAIGVHAQDYPAAGKTITLIVPFTAGGPTDKVARDLAESMREEIRGLIRAGKTDQEVIEFLTARYGDFVLFRPPFKPLTYLLWVGPFVFLGFGAVVWFFALRARRTFKSAPVSGEQIAAAARLLEDKT